MRGLKRNRSARVVVAGHALVQSIRRGHYELVVEVPGEPADGGGVRWPRHGDLNYDGDRGFSRPQDAQLQLRL